MLSQLFVFFIETGTGRRYNEIVARSCGGWISLLDGSDRACWFRIVPCRYIEDLYLAVLINYPYRGGRCPFGERKRQVREGREQIGEADGAILLWCSDRAITCQRLGRFDRRTEGGTLGLLLGFWWLLTDPAAEITGNSIVRAATSGFVDLYDLLLIGGTMNGSGAFASDRVVEALVRSLDTLVANVLFAAADAAVSFCSIAARISFLVRPSSLCTPLLVERGRPRRLCMVGLRSSTKDPTLLATGQWPSRGPR
jgi:hypothetical protein